MEKKTEKGEVCKGLLKFSWELTRHHFATFYWPKQVMRSAQIQDVGHRVYHLMGDAAVTLQRAWKQGEVKVCGHFGNLAFVGQKSEELRGYLKLSKLTRPSVSSESGQSDTSA